MHRYASDHDELEDWILANAPEFVEGMKEAERELLEGHTYSLEEVTTEIEGDGATKGKTKRRK